MQIKIYLFSKFRNIHQVFFYQSVLVRNLSARFYVVKNVFDDSTFLSPFSFADKLNLVIHLKNYFYFSFNNVFTFQFQKKGGYVSSFVFKSVYHACLSFLFCVVLLPILEALSDRFGVNLSFNDEDNNLLFFPLQYRLINQDFINYAFSTEVFDLLSYFKAFENFAFNYIPLSKIFLDKFLRFFKLFCTQIGSGNDLVFNSFYEFLFLGLLRFGHERIFDLFKALHEEA